MAAGGIRSVSVTVLMRNYGRIIDQVMNGKVTMLVTGKGRPSVAIVPVDEYEELLEARRMLALARPARPADQPMNEGGGDRGPV